MSVPDHGGPVRNWAEAVAVWPSLKRFEPHCCEALREAAVETLTLADWALVQEELDASDEDSVVGLVFIFGGEAAHHHAERLFLQLFHAFHMITTGEGIGIRIVVESTVAELSPPVKH